MTPSLDIVLHLCYAILALGLYLLATQKERAGFGLMTVANFAMVIVGSQTGITSMILWPFLFTALNLIGFVQAGRRAS